MGMGIYVYTYIHVYIHVYALRYFIRETKRKKKESDFKRWKCKNTETITLDIMGT